MARITVEDCLENVDSRFQLVLVAAKRARQLINGSPTELDWENDKATVLALREIAKGLIGPSILEPAKPEEMLEEIFDTGDDIESQARAMLEAERTAEAPVKASSVLDAAEEKSEEAPAPVSVASKEDPKEELKEEPKEESRDEVSESGASEGS